MLKTFKQPVLFSTILMVFLCCSRLAYSQTVPDKFLTNVSNNQFVLLSAPRISQHQIGYLGWTSLDQLPKLYIYNIPSKKTEVVDNLTPPYSMWEPNRYWDLDNGGVVMESMIFSQDPPPPILYYRNLFTGEQQTVSEFDTFWPRIFENKIVYASERNGLPDIYVFNANNGQETKITQGGGCFHNEPDIWGDYVVYLAYSCDNSVHGYNLTTNEDFVIGKGYNYGETNPNINNNRVVYVSDRDGHTDIYMYDIDTKQETRITNVNSLKFVPRIDGDWIVWQEQGANYNIHIYGYNLKYHMGGVIVQNAFQGQLGLSDNKLVCMLNRNGIVDIYMVDLSKIQPKPKDL